MAESLDAPSLTIFVHEINTTHMKKHQNFPSSKTLSIVELHYVLTTYLRTSLGWACGVTLFRSMPGPKYINQELITFAAARARPRFGP
jgi:hypothetical protein